MTVRAPCHDRFELIFANLDVGSARLFANANAVDSCTFRTQRTADFNDPRAVVSGIANLDEGADLEGFNEVLRRHYRFLPCTSPWGCAEDARHFLIHYIVE